MPKVLRPRQEFPTPLFRAFLAVAAPLVGSIPGWVFIPRWENPRGYLLVLGFACLVVAVLVATSRRLVRAAVLGALVILVGVVGVELLVGLLRNVE
jgi:hypothetical protein